MYQLTNRPMVIKLGATPDKNVWIPIAPGNIEYEEYVKWLAAGNTPLPADIVPEVVNKVADFEAILPYLETEEDTRAALYVVCDILKGL